MKAPLCRHYWENRENAAWKPVDFPVPEIENALKSEFSLIQLERPKFRVYGRWTVFFAFRRESDVFGRPIFPATMTFLRDCENPDEAGEIIVPLLENVAHAADFVNLPGRIFPRRRFRFRFYAIIFIIFFALIAVVFFRTGTKSPNPGEAPGEKNALKPSETLPDSIPEICRERDLRLELYDCPASYLRAYCDGSASLPLYRSWFAEAASCSAARRNAFAADEKAVFKRTPKPEQKEAIMKLLFDSGSFKPNSR